jgi:diguanylate cyclase (GGDEF)-like protein
MGACRPIGMRGNMRDSPYKILLADDDPVQRKLLVGAILDCEPGLEITTAGSGEELFAALSKQAFDCLVLDCHMPPLGPKQIIGSPSVRAAGCRVIAMSSCPDQSVVIDSLRGGAVDFVPKSQAMMDGFLWTCVQRAIEYKREQDEFRKQSEMRQQVLELQAHTDPLTGLCNRRGFERRGSDGRRVSDHTPTACMMLDIDHFKSINDRFGHAAGDAVLAAVGQFVQASIRPGDSAYRWGGEEFLILRPGSGPGESLLWADEIRRRLAAMPIALGDAGQPLRVTSSIGVETAMGGGCQKDVIERADQAMYLAKRTGRNRVCTWPMVKIDQALKALETMRDSSVEEKRSKFLAECESALSGSQRDEVTWHCERVARLARDMGRIQGMPPAMLHRLSEAGLLHDIGKCLVPFDLLEKKEKLSPAEWDVMGRTPADGAKIGGTLGADRATVEAIRLQRHWYGESTAKTRRRRQDRDVQRMTAVLQVADAFIALTTGRPYREKLSPEAAQKELEGQRGKRFDPAALDALVAESGAIAAAA